MVNAVRSFGGLEPAPVPLPAPPLPEGSLASTLFGFMAPGPVPPVPPAHPASAAAAHKKPTAMPRYPELLLRPTADSLVIGR
jgi:hypothetical protein